MARLKCPKDSDPLSNDDIEIIRRWINDGANWRAGFRLKESSVTSFDWWSYKSIQHPAVPEVQSEWVRTPIDCFVFEKLRQNGLSPASRRIVTHCYDE